MSSMTIDPQIAEIFVALAEELQAAGSVSLPTRGDALALRALAEPAMAYAPAPESAGVSLSVHEIETSDGARIGLRWFTPESDMDTGRPAVVYVHGGGMIAGRAEHFDGMLRYYVQESRVPFAAVDYRLAPERTGTGLAEDVLDAITWLRGHASDLGVDPDRIAVMGDSGGGGVAAGAAILARERDIKLAAQVLIYPMLDDRTVVPDPQLAPFVTWDWDANWTCWNAVLGADVGGEDVSPVAAPARLSDFSGLPKAYIEVGELDIFRDEAVNYAERLHQAGISCELHVLPGVTHGHDRLSVDIDVTRRSLADRCRVIAAL